MMRELPERNRIDRHETVCGNRTATSPQNGLTSPAGLLFEDRTDIILRDTAVYLVQGRVSWSVPYIDRHLLSWHR